jgi:hypothetical protein
MKTKLGVFFFGVSCLLAVSSQSFASHHYYYPTKANAYEAVYRVAHSPQYASYRTATCSWYADPTNFFHSFEDKDVNWSHFMRDLLTLNLKGDATAYYHTAEDRDVNWSRYFKHNVKSAWKAFWGFN